MALSSWLTGLFGNSKDTATGDATNAATPGQVTPGQQAPDPATPGEPGKQVPEEWAREIAQILAPVDNPPPKQGTTRAGFARDILGYVLSGEPAAVLHEVGQTVVVGNQLQTLGYGVKPNHITAIYKHFNQLPNAVALRWAKLLEAASRASARVHTTFHMNMPQGARWLEALLLHTSGQNAHTYTTEKPKVHWLLAQKLEELLVEDGLEPHVLVTGAFSTALTGANKWAETRLLTVTRVSGYPNSLQRHVEAIRPYIAVTDSDQRLFVLKLLESAFPETVEALAEPLCELATSTHKQVRHAAAVLLEKGGPAIFEPLRVRAKEGKPEQRQYALRLIAALAGKRQDENQLTFARETASADNAPSVQALISEWVADQAAAQQAPSYEYEIPQVNWDPESNRIPAHLLRKFWDSVRNNIDKHNARLRENHATMVQKYPQFKLHQIAPYKEQDEPPLQAFLESQPRNESPKTHSGVPPFNVLEVPIRELAASEEVTPVALFKVLRYFDMLLRNGRIFWQGFAFMKQIRERTGHPTALELAQMLEGAGISSDCLLFNYWQTWSSAVLEDWPSEQLWPYFAHNIDTLIRALTQDMGPAHYFDRAKIFRTFAHLPSVPAKAIGPLFAVALGSAKTDRPGAQEAVSRLPDKETRIIAALSDGKAETRAVAAQWLGKLRHAPAIEALETAVAKEKNDVTKGALLDTLELLGRPVDKYLKRDSLEAEARKTLGKAIPKDLEWFPWSALPEAHWADSGQPVPADVVKLFLVQAVKQKSPEPNSVLRKYCAMLTPRDREALGQFVLDAWLQEDVKPISADEAMTKARAHATALHQSMTRYPQHWANNPLLGKSVDELTASSYPQFARQAAGSAIGSKGLLAIAAACAAERAAPPVQRYLKEWYGTRAAQGKSLISMLAWIEHPSAIQLMLSVGSRFRTKSFQEEATRQAEALAERKGWTLAELADRTVPSGGFDESGELELSYGPRQFIARLLPDFKIELFNPEGKKIASLPEPRQDDDAEAAAAAKKTFSASKKEIKSVVEMQTDRLYEALCTQRQWSFDDWSTYLQRHPVLRHLVQRLVWVEIRADGDNRAFRPLDDGTLTDHEDNAVEISAEARIQVAHDSLLKPERVALWQQHLVDYEIKPLFTQLGRGMYALPTDKAAADRIADFEGYLIEAFALRGRATKLGYTRGPTEDGGWFFSYEKRFPTLGIQATIEFSGNGLPEENRVVALTQLTFAGTDKSGGSRGSGLKLARIPATLLSECYQDLKLLAAEGKGYDPDWKKAVGW